MAVSKSKICIGRNNDHENPWVLKDEFVQNAEKEGIKIDAGEYVPKGDNAKYFVYEATHKEDTEFLKALIEKIYGTGNNVEVEIAGGDVKDSIFVKPQEDHSPVTPS